MTSNLGIISDPEPQKKGTCLEKYYCTNFTQ